MAQFIPGASKILAAATATIREQVQVSTLPAADLVTHHQWEKEKIRARMQAHLEDMDSSTPAQRVLLVTEFAFFCRAVLNLLSMMTTGLSISGLSGLVYKHLRENSILRPETLFVRVAPASTFFPQHHRSLLIVSDLPSFFFFFFFFFFLFFFFQNAVELEALTYQLHSTRWLESLLGWATFRELLHCRSIVQGPGSLESIADILHLALYEEAFRRFSRRNANVEWLPHYDAAFLVPRDRDHALRQLLVHQNPPAWKIIMSRGEVSPSVVALHVGSSTGNWIVCRLFQFCTGVLGLEESDLSGAFVARSGTLSILTQTPSASRSLWAGLGSLVQLQASNTAGELSPPPLLQQTQQSLVQLVPPPIKEPDDWKPREISLKDLPWGNREAALWLACWMQLKDRMGIKNYTNLLRRSRHHGFYHRERAAVNDLTKEWKKGDASTRKIFRDPNFKEHLANFVKHGIDMGAEAQTNLQRYSEAFSRLDQQKEALLSRLGIS